MWGVWGLEGAIAVLFFVLLVPVLLAPFLHTIYGRYGRFAGGPAFLAIGAGLYGCALVAFTLFPLPDVDALRCARDSLQEYWQLDPLASPAKIATVIGEQGAVAALGSSVFLQAAMNVVFFLPLGFLAGYRARASLGKTLLVGLAVSLAIETTQGSANWGLFPAPIGSSTSMISSTTRLVPASDGSWAPASEVGRRSRCRSRRPTWSGRQSGGGPARRSVT